MSRGGKNWDSSLIFDGHQQESSTTTTTSNSPVTTSNKNGKRQCTWNEIHSHSNKTDRWIVIDNQVYDVTRWVKHPGGQSLLNQYAGQDATVRHENKIDKNKYQSSVLFFRKLSVLFILILLLFKNISKRFILVM